jgi:hypothetical protein
MEDETHPRSVGLVVVLFGIAVFYGFQTVFWWAIASKEAQHTVDKKTAALYTFRDVLYRNDLQREMRFLDSAMDRIWDNSRSHVEADRAAQNAYNAHRTKTWLFPVLGLIVLLLLLCIGYNAFHGHRLAFGHRMGLLFVLLGYVTEILLFLLVVDRFVVIGDFDLLRRGLGFTAR